MGTGIAALLALAGFSIGVRPLSDNSLFTHIATGRLQLAEGFLRADPYSYTAAGEPWVVQSWLPSFVYGLLDALGDGTAIRLLGGVLAGGLALLVWRLTTPGRTLLPRALIGALVVAIGAAFWVPRPLLFGLLAFATVLVWSEERRNPRWLVPLFWLWANSHGSFPLGLVLLAALALGRRLDGDRPDDELRALGWAVVGTLLAVVGPLGPQVLSFPLNVLSRREILASVVEWKPPPLSAGWAQLFVLQVVVALIAVVRRRTFRDLLPMVVFVVAAAMATRNVPLASLVLVPGTARGLAGLGSLPVTQRNALASVLVAASVLLVGVQVALAVRGPAYDLHEYPVAELDWLRDRGLLGRDVRLLTEDTNGNLIELLEGADVPVFLDDRYDMYPLEVMRDYLRVHRVQDGWQDVLDRYRVDVVLWASTEPAHAAIAGDPDWRVVRDDGTWFIACRRGSAADARCGDGG